MNLHVVICECGIVFTMLLCDRNAGAMMLFDPETWHGKLQPVRITAGRETKRQVQSKFRNWAASILPALSNTEWPTYVTDSNPDSLLHSLRMYTDPWTYGQHKRALDNHNVYYICSLSPIQNARPNSDECIPRLKSVFLHADGRRVVFFVDVDQEVKRYERDAVVARRREPQRFFTPVAITTGTDGEFRGVIFYESKTDVTASGEVERCEMNFHMKLNCGVDNEESTNAAIQPLTKPDVDKLSGL